MLAKNLPKKQCCILDQHRILIRKKQNKTKHYLYYSLKSKYFFQWGHCNFVDANAWFFKRFTTLMYVLQY